MTDTDKYEETDHPELVEFEGETLGDTLTNLLAEVKRLREQYLELRDALVGDSPNWTHEELIERALELVGEEECTNKAQDN